MNGNPRVITIIDENVDQIEGLIQKKVDIWATFVLFSPLWWFGVSLSIIHWILWLLFRKKDSTDRLLYVAFFVIVISLVLDVLGDQLGFWHYRYNVIPVLPTYLPWDLTLMPVTIMFLLQIKPKLNPLIKAVLFAVVTSYVVEPIITWMNIYQPINWRYTYSVPFQIIIFMIAYYLTKRKAFSYLDS
ncbi:CBO0543 family protein [Pseudalkalibacillus sp. A8]|uniref:CBO0543 family protein n=1 Tax=Pseudalkalibacillus sp. A8 TaxID=3382641 RepID=UPI0038B44073